MGMEALAVDLQLLRSLMVSDLNLTVGRSLMARVASIEAATGRGRITLAGATLEAELPKELQAGQEIRLLVRELTPEKVVLGLQERPPLLAQPVMLPLPGGGAIEVRERHEPQGGGTSDGGGGVHTLSLVYDAPALGSVEMRFALDPASLRLVVTVPAGASYEAALDGADALGQALSAALERTVTVKLEPRHEPVDIYA